MVASVGQIDGGSRNDTVSSFTVLVMHLGCSSGSWPTMAHNGRGHGGWPRLVSFGEVTVVPMLGEVLWVRWWQQCIATTTCGVLRKVLVVALGTSG